MPKRQTSEGCREDDNDLQEGETILDIDAKHEEDTEFVPKLAKKAFESMVHLETVVLYDDAKPLQPAKAIHSVFWDAVKRTDFLGLRGSPKHETEMHRRHVQSQQQPFLQQQGSFAIRFPILDGFQIGTHALHLAIYIMDRFIERYHGDACATLPIVTFFDRIESDLVPDRGDFHVCGV